MMGRRNSVLTDFFKNNYDKLRGYTQRMIHEKQELDAEDLIQDVFHGLLDRGDVFSSIKNISGYIFHSIRNKIIDYSRTSKSDSTISINAPVRHDVSISIGDLIEDPHHGTEYIIESRQFQQIFYSCLEKLTPVEQKLIIETEFEGKSFKELALEFEVPVGTLLSKKSRALKKFAKCCKNNLRGENNG